MIRTWCPCGLRQQGSSILSRAHGAPAGSASRDLQPCLVHMVPLRALPAGIINLVSSTRCPCGLCQQGSSTLSRPHGAPAGSASRDLQPCLVHMVPLRALPAGIFNLVSSTRCPCSASRDLQPCLVHTVPLRALPAGIIHLVSSTRCPCGLCQQGSSILSRPHGTPAGSASRDHPSCLVHTVPLRAPPAGIINA